MPISGSHRPDTFLRCSKNIPVKHLRNTEKNTEHRIKLWNKLLYHTIRKPLQVLKSQQRLEMLYKTFRGAVHYFYFTYFWSKVTPHLNFICIYLSQTVILSTVCFMMNPFCVSGTVPFSTASSKFLTTTSLSRSARLARRKCAHFDFHAVWPHFISEATSFFHAPKV